MPNKLLALLLSTIAVLVAVGVIVLRRSRTEHPPVAPAPPRIEDFRGTGPATDAGSAGNL